ncbi:hypothetical protein PINS_up003990 [Pythium insidiosum]|nr:hypothetical protein PINS_up003990 [Pythium insidiosum]
MVLAPVSKAVPPPVIAVANAPTTSIRLGHMTASSRRSEPKMSIDQSNNRSARRMTRWPTSPVAFKRFSAAPTLSSPVQLVKQSFADDETTNQTDLEQTCAGAAVTGQSGEESFAARWKRIMKGPHEDVGLYSDIDPVLDKRSHALIDLLDSRNSLATIGVQVRQPEKVALPGCFTEEIDVEVKLMKGSLFEELEEFQRDGDQSIKTFPEYFSMKEKKLIQEVAESLHLSCHLGERIVTVSKSRNSDHSISHRGIIGKSRHSGESILNDEIYVDVNSLAKHGQDGFIARLRLRRLNSGGGIRRKMLWDVAQLSTTDGVAHAVDEGEGGVYAVQSRSSGEKLAMFKPAEEERFVREGIAPGEGAIREEAAYVLDSRSSGFSGVPPTAVARIHLASIGRSKHGAVQRFMMSSIGSMEGFGMPYDLAKAAAFIPVEQVHRIGLLDIRTFNTDRHPGNILLIGDKPPYTMVPIDHGCILPSWFHLSEARFDWLEYPQSKVPFSSQALNYIDDIDVDADASALRKLGIREECVTTMRICVLFLKLAAHAGQTLHWMGTFMQRSGCFEAPSNLEMAIHEACAATGIPFAFELNEHNEQKAQAVHGILGRRPPRLFFTNLERILSRELHQ